jgi:hypothetical protein
MKRLAGNAARISREQKNPSRQQKSLLPLQRIAAPVV